MYLLIKEEKYDWISHMSDKNTIYYFLKYELQNICIIIIIILSYLCYNYYYLFNLYKIDFNNIKL